MYLQTRKLLRDIHFKRAEMRRNEYWLEEDDSIMDVNGLKVRKNLSIKPSLTRSPRNKSVSYNPNLQSMRSNFSVEPLISSAEKFVEARNGSLVGAPRRDSPNRLSMSHGIGNNIEMAISGPNSQPLTASLEKSEYSPAFK